MITEFQCSFAGLYLDAHEPRNANTRTSSSLHGLMATQASSPVVEIGGCHAKQRRKIPHAQAIGFLSSKYLAIPVRQPRAARWAPCNQFICKHERQNGVVICSPEEAAR